MRYDLGRAWFATPKGRRALMYIREGTNDLNTCYASMTEDEYNVRSLDLHGLAIDIGGYLGSVSIALLIDNPDLRVVCVEPVPDNQDLIERNASVNGVADRLTLIRGAAGRGGEPVTVAYGYTGTELELHHAFVGNSTIAQSAETHLEAHYTAVSLSDLMGDEDAAFLKIDCEGGEYSILTDPAVARIARITGEWHNVPLPDGTTGSQDRIRALLEPTHAVTFSGPVEGPGGFDAVRR